MILQDGRLNGLAFVSSRGSTIVSEHRGHDRPHAGAVRYGRLGMTRRQDPRRVEDYPLLDGIVKHPGAAISENRPIPSYWLWAESSSDRPRRS
jgi:hypothetical protein